MKSTGIVRKVDELGRVVLPIELRRTLNIEVKDSLEIFVDDDKIILKKYEPSDIFTGSMDNLIEFNGKKVSVDSIREMARIAGLHITD
ncbi:MAG TPA: AbrB/MazE/SpoVT family DNA-binding domain-containing protein [Firmicutes bacterium]|nr:AbrB/MazE/SpoVT family DNA-binding domain-containing protein [Bacillota bacterium]